MPHIRHHKYRQLTADELEFTRREIVDHLIEVEKIEAEKKAEIKVFTDRLRPHKSEIMRLTKLVRTGVDEREAYCRVVVDSVTRTVRFIIEKSSYDHDTNRYVTEDVLFDEKTFEEVGEQQLTLWEANEAQEEGAALSDDEIHFIVGIANQILELDPKEDSPEPFDEEHAVDTIEQLCEKLSEYHALILAATGKPWTSYWLPFRNRSLRAGLDGLQELLDILEKVEPQAYEHFRTSLDGPSTYYVQGLTQALLDHREELTLTAPTN